MVTIIFRPAANVVKFTNKIGQVLSHLNERVGYLNFAQFLGAVEDGLSERRRKIKSRIPSAAAGIVESAAVWVGMAVGSHHDRSIRGSGNPFVSRDVMQQSQFSRNSIIRPSFKFKYGREVLRRGHIIEKTDWGINAWNQPMRVWLVQSRDGQIQFQPPRRASNKRRTLYKLSISPRDIKSTGGLPPKRAFEFGSLIHRSANPRSL